ncbi:MAG: hypothetical protein KDD83_02055 [Caldilineaceae bacterium]|nr:hypothetical protein [Caldilineaceae bacterium]
MRAILRKLKYGHWVVTSYMGRTYSVRHPAMATILITYFSPARMKHIEPQLRHVLKCKFAEKVIVSNHNPDVRIEDLVHLKDPRLHFVNQDVARGCGYRWLVAKEFDPEYLIVMDDDLLLTARQLHHLFLALLHNTNVPHGYAGMVRMEGYEIAYTQCEEKPVDYLCEIYATTRAQLTRYLDLRMQVGANPELKSMIDAAADFMVISRTGDAQPEIHETRRLFRCSTFMDQTIAVHKAPGFDASVMSVGRALDEIQ